MDFLELVKDRYSVRDFLDKEIEQEKLDKVLLAGNLAPTACNRQPQRIYVLKSEEAIKKIREVTKMAFNAPIVLLICADTKEAWYNPFNESYNSSEMDSSIVATHMMLEAWNIGISSVWIKYFDHKLLKERFALPDDIEPICLLPIGYKNENYEPSKLHNIRKDIKDIVQYL